jgi:type IV pilus assembly protein PilB
VLAEQQLLMLESDFFHVPIIELKDQTIDPTILNLVPEPIAHRSKVISFARDDEGLSLAMIDPSDIQIKEFIKKKTGLEIKPFLMGTGGWNYGLSQYHTNLEGEIKNLVRAPGDGLIGTGKQEDVDLKKMAEEIPVVRVVDTLLEYAVLEKASDIHIEPQENAVSVRYRIDGVLHDAMTLPKAIQLALIARIKVLSNLKIDEHRLPQDGRFKVERDGYKFSLRVSTIPVFDGEKVVIRLLDESSKAMGLDQMGFLPSQLDIVMRNIKKPHGMFLVTGPTGSGKSTTLYAVLSLLNTKNVNISTIEDPVEYRIVGANQMQVSPKIGLTFAMGLRALLRQDPNIIMIGEIRDAETAEEAMHAAMTGHIVVSTLHTNNAAGALPRLLDLGQEPFLIASTVNTILAQRLVRGICKECKQEVKLEPTLVKVLEKQFDFKKLIDVLLREKIVEKTAKSFADLVFYKGTGCAKCNNTGYRGRGGIYELLEVTPEVGELVSKRASTQELQDAAEAAGMVLLWQHGFIKAIQGGTTIEEILRVTKE